MNNCSIKSFIDTEITNEWLKELLSEFFKEHDLFFKNVSSITDDIKKDLAKKVIECKLFDKQYSDIMVELNKAKILPKEDDMWAVLEGIVKVQIPDWVRKVNPIVNIKGSKKHILLLVGTKEKGIVSLKGILPLITINFDNLCCLVLDDGKYYILISNPKNNLNSWDKSGITLDWLDCFYEFSHVSIKSIICGEDDEDEYTGLCPDDVYYYSNLDFSGTIPLQDYMELSYIDQEKIDKLITVQKYKNDYGEDRIDYFFGLGYFAQEDKLIVVLPLGECYV